MPWCSDLHHIFKLTHVQIVVEALLRKQLRCIALLDDAAVVDDEDTVGLLDRGKAVRPFKSCSMPSCTRISVLVSILLVASSRIRMRGSDTIVRAKASSCF